MRDTRDELLCLAPKSRTPSGWYDVRLDLFNGKEIPVGLRDISVVFVCSGGKVRSVPMDKATKELKGSMPRAFYESAYVVDLPPRQWVIKELFGRFEEADDIRLLSGWYRVEFVGQRQRRGLFEPKTLCKVIASRPPYSDPSKDNKSLII